MTGFVIETVSKQVNGEIRHFLVIEFNDLRYTATKSLLTIPLDESNGSCVGDLVKIEIQP
jgi:hypothetical protein